MKTMRNQRSLVSVDALDDRSLATEVLAFLAQDARRLSSFLDESGLVATELRSQINDGAFRRGLLDFVASDDDVLISFAASVGRPPAHIAAELARFRSPSFD